MMASAVCASKATLGPRLRTRVVRPPHAVPYVPRDHSGSAPSPQPGRDPGCRPRVGLSGRAPSVTAGTIRVGPGPRALGSCPPCVTPGTIGLGPPGRAPSHGSCPTCLGWCSRVVSGGALGSPPRATRVVLSRVCAPGSTVPLSGPSRGPGSALGVYPPQ